MSTDTFRRLPAIDAIKAIASQLIVLHHLAFYGPMSDSAYTLMPDLIGWLSDYGRIAVQAFLVAGGFLAAHGLAPAGEARIERPHAMLVKRYLRLALPFGAALLLTIACSAWARSWLADDMIPAAPHALQFAVHLLLLQDVLHIDALSAGAWYVAIDFQLFALLLGLLWLGRRLEARIGNRFPLGQWMVCALAAASLFYFNRLTDWDNLAVYFFGAYALGVCARWALAQGPARERLPMLLTLTMVALAMDFRARILVAMLTAGALVLAVQRERVSAWLDRPWLNALSRISYAVFLVHFAVLVVINTVFACFMPADPWVQAFGMLFAWLTSLFVGAGFHLLIEQRANAWASRVLPAAGRRLAN